MQVTGYPMFALFSVPWEFPNSHGSSMTLLLPPIGTSAYSHFPSIVGLGNSHGTSPMGVEKAY